MKLCSSCTSICGWVMLITFLSVLEIARLTLPAGAHQPSRPDLNGWFDSLKSEKGPCCSNADGTVLQDVDWEAKDGHYRVRIDDKWWDVPDDAVLRQPNLFGPTMVWPVRFWADQTQIVNIRCFLPGTMI